MNFSNINYNLYKIFVTVYECRNISHAAKELYIGQPNVSRSIKELERQVGVKLFYSNPRGVEPTNDGQVLYHKVAPALAWIDYGERSLKEINERTVAAIRRTCVTNFAECYFAPYISKYKKKYPNVQFHIFNKSAEDALDLLERNRVDLIFSTFPIHDKNGFEKKLLAAMPETGIASHEFAALHKLGKTITSEQFNELPYICMHPEEPLKTPDATVDSQEMLFQLVKNNFGVGFCGKHFLEFSQKNDTVFTFSIKGVKLPTRFFLCTYNKNYINKITEIFLQGLSQI